MLDVDFDSYVQESMQTISQLSSQCGNEIQSVIERIVEVFLTGGRLYLCGNGGSAADSQHIAAEFINGMSDFLRHPLPAIALTTDTSVMTSLANDHSFDTIFKRQLEAFAKPDDILFGISTSGTSVNVGIAMEYAKKSGMTTVLLSGAKKNTLLSRYIDFNILIPNTETPHIQESMLVVEHFICAQVIRHFVTHGKAE